PLVPPNAEAGSACIHERDPHPLPALKSPSRIPAPPASASLRTRPARARGSAPSCDTSLSIPSDSDNRRRSDCCGKTSPALLPRDNLFGPIRIRGPPSPLITPWKGWLIPLAPRGRELRHGLDSLIKSKN